MTSQPDRLAVRGRRSGLVAAAGRHTRAALTIRSAFLRCPTESSARAAGKRRFNRRRYDAARTVDRFAVRLRDQVDLDVLRTELLAVVDQTVQPTQASLWLRAPAATRPSP